MLNDGNTPETGVERTTRPETDRPGGETTPGDREVTPAPKQKSIVLDSLLRTKPEKNSDASTTTPGNASSIKSQVVDPNFLLSQLVLLFNLLFNDKTFLPQNYIISDNPVLKNLQNVVKECINSKKSSDAFNSDECNIIRQHYQQEQIKTYL